MSSTSAPASTTNQDHLVASLECGDGATSWGRCISACVAQRLF